MTALLVALSCAAVVSAQTPADFSGRWVSVPEQFTVVSRVPFLRNGWWRDADPASTISQPTQLETTFLLELDASRTRLSMTVAVGDEKGQRGISRSSPGPSSRELDAALMA